MFACYIFNSNYPYLAGGKNFAPLVQIFVIYRACFLLLLLLFLLSFSFCIFIYSFCLQSGPVGPVCLGSANGFCFRSCLALHNAASMIITPKNKRENERKMPAEQIERRIALEPAPSSCPHSTLHS